MARVIVKMKSGENPGVSILSASMFAYYVEALCVDKPKLDLNMKVDGQTTHIVTFTPDEQHWEGEDVLDMIERLINFFFRSCKAYHLGMAEQYGQRLHDEKPDGVMAYDVDTKRPVFQVVDDFLLEDKNRDKDAFVKDDRTILFFVNDDPLFAVATLLGSPDDSIRIVNDGEDKDAPVMVGLDGCFYVQADLVQKAWGLAPGKGDGRKEANRRAREIPAFVDHPKDKSGSWNNATATIVIMEDDRPVKKKVTLNGVSYKIHFKTLAERFPDLFTQCPLSSAMATYKQEGE